MHCIKNYTKYIYISNDAYDNNGNTMNTEITLKDLEAYFAKDETNMTEEEKLAEAQIDAINTLLNTPNAEAYRAKYNAKVKEIVAKHPWLKAIAPMH